MVPQVDSITHQEFVAKTQTLIETPPYDEKFIWAIYGDSGTGKTLAASLLLKESIKRGHKAKYIIWVDLLTKKLSGKEAEEYLERIKNVDMLCIDEINNDALRESKFPQETLDTILKYRYSNKKPTILVLSNRMLPTL